MLGAQVFAGRVTGPIEELASIVRNISAKETPALATLGFPVPAARGRLVAFDAGLLHEVTPVHAGTRFAVVDRYR